MSFIPLQAIWLIISFGILIASYKLIKGKSWKSLSVLWAVVIISFMASPIRYQSTSGGGIEANTYRFSELPSKVEVESKSFNQKQTEEMSQLKSQSKGLKNEIHD